MARKRKLKKKKSKRGVHGLRPGMTV